MTDYPQWICGDCGKRHGSAPNNHCATYHIGSACGWCGTTTEAVTEPRDWRYPPAPLPKLAERID